MPTDFLEIPYLAQNVAQPEIPENESKDILDYATAGQLIIDINDDIDHNLDDSGLFYPKEWQASTLIITNTISFNSGIVSIIIPSGKRTKYVVHNNTTTGFNVRIIQTGLSVLVPDQEVYEMYCDGVDVRRISI